MCWKLLSVGSFLEVVLCCLFKLLYPSTVWNAQTGELTGMYNDFLFPKLSLLKEIQLKHVKREKCDWQLSCCTCSGSSVSGCQSEITCKPGKMAEGNYQEFQNEIFGLKRTQIRHFLLWFLCVLLSTCQTWVWEIKGLDLFVFCLEIQRYLPLGDHTLGHFQGVLKPFPHDHFFGCGTVFFCCWPW